MITLYAVLIVAGILMLGAEIYLPGGILGVAGAICLVGAIAVGFQIDPTFGWLSAALVVVGTGVGVWLWIRLFPRTGVGRRLTLSADGREFKAPPAELKSLVGREGVTQTDLRPAGIAQIDGRRVDVVADGAWIEAGRPIRVLAVEGVRVVVGPAGAPPAL